MSSVGPQPFHPAFNPLLGLQRTLGNQAVVRLFESGAIQAKLRVSQPGDSDELEADRVAEQITSSGRGPALQRSCSCAGGSPCSKCAEEEEETLHRSAATPVLRSFQPSIQRFPADQSPAPEPAGPAPTAATPPVRGTARPPLIVDDDALALAPGQMKKSQFMAELRSRVCGTADAALAAVGRSTKSCPYIEQWLAFYAAQDSGHIERAIHKYAPETARATRAQEYFSIINDRVRQAVTTWAKTGRITGVPPGVPLMPTPSGPPGAEASPAAGGQSDQAKAAGGPAVSSSRGQNVLAKRQNGGTAKAADAGAVRERLGPGRPMDGTVRSRMESAFGQNFSHVRLHTDSNAAKLSTELNARAFTIGEDVAFASGEYKPGTMVGDALIAHELAHVVQQGGGASPTTVARSPEAAGLEADADHSAAAAVSSLLGKANGTLRRITTNALPLLRSGLRLQRCRKSAREIEIERLGNLQFGFMEEKRKAEEARLKKEAEEEAKKKGLPPAVNQPKVEMGEVIKKEEGEHALKGSPTAEWDNADQPAWRKRAADAWTAVVASVKGTELEAIAKGVTFNFDPKAALEGGFYASQNDHTLTVGMSWVRFAELDPKNVWENLAHEMGGHLKYGVTYAKEIMDSALSRLSSADRARFVGDSQKFFETYEYPETEIYASLWQRRYRHPVGGPERPSGGIDPDVNIEDKLKVMKDVLHPEVAKEVLKELKHRVDANDQILQRDKDFFVVKVKAVFGYDL